MNKKFKKNLKQKREYQKQYQDIKRRSIINDIAKEIICDRSYTNDSILKHISDRVSDLMNDNTVRPPVDYMGITDIRPDLLSLFVKPEGE